MSDEVLGMINQATKEGLLTPEEKLSLKEMLLDGNGIVLEYAEEYKEDGDKKKFLGKVKEYLKMCADSDDDEQKKNDIAKMASPEGEMLHQIKKKRNEKKVKEEDNFANIEECEEGLSPKVIFNKK